MEAVSHDGGCACGYVRYRMTSEPLFVHCCHCRRCQRQSGSAFAVNALIESDRVRLLEGDVEKIAMESPSGLGQDIYRCPKCRVAVWSNYFKLGETGRTIHFIRVGALDEPGRISPDIHIYTASKQPWVVLPPDDLAVEVSYEIETTWPKGSLERRRKLLAPKGA